jgi:hypothetical protein
MLVEVWCELVCAYCLQSLEGQYVEGEFIPREQLLKTALEHGRAVNLEGEVFCNPRCRVQMTHQRLEQREKTDAEEA